MHMQAHCSTAALVSDGGEKWSGGGGELLRGLHYKCLLALLLLLLLLA